MGRAETQRLPALDAVLLDLRRAYQRPAYRRRILDGLPRDIELATLRVLRAIELADDAPSVGKIGAMLEVDPSTASRLVERSVKAGLVERQPCADDRRRTRLELRPVGRNMVEEVAARRLAILEEATRSWRPAELDQAIELLRRLQAGFDQLEQS